MEFDGDDTLRVGVVHLHLLHRSCQKADTQIHMSVAGTVWHLYNYATLHSEEEQGAEEHQLSESAQDEEVD